jgi:hypothetical protein
MPTPHMARLGHTIVPLGSIDASSGVCRSERLVRSEYPAVFER